MSEDDSEDTVGHEISDSGAGETEPAAAASDEAIAHVDRSRAVMLSGGDASKFMAQLSSAAKSGRSIRSALVVGDVFELVPSDELKKGLKNGTLRAATSKNGDASVLVKHVKSGQIAGEASLQRVGVPLKAIGGAGLSAISFAVEQKQLAEIAKRLDQIQLTADEARKLQLDDRAAAARGARRVAAEVRRAFEASGRVPPALVSEMLDARAAVEGALDKRLETVERHLKEYEKDTLKGKDAETYFREDFVGLADAVDGLALANAALVSISYEAEQELLDMQASAAQSLAVASDAVGKALMDCLRLTGAREDGLREFQERLAEGGWGKLPSWMHWTLWEAPKGLGSFRAIRDVKPWDKPRKALPEATVNLLREAGRDDVGTQPLIAEVVDGDRLLIGPAVTDVANG